MSQIPSNSLPTGGLYPSPRPGTPLPRPEVPSPEPRPLPQYPSPRPGIPQPLPYPQPQPLPFPQPQPLPFPRPNPLDKFLTPQRSERMADKQGDQLENIQRGVQQGTISEQEATRLLDQQARIADATARASSDGVVTAAEAAGIQRLQSRADQSIFEAESTQEYGFSSPDLNTTRIQAQQIGSIAEGIRSGNLSGSEAGSLLRDQANIARAAARAQDIFSQDPFAKIDVALRQLSAEFNIRNEKSDFERAPHGRLNFPVQLF